MHPLAEAQAVALLLQHPTGWIHVFCDGSSRWSTAPPDATSYWDPSDVPEPVVCQRRTYQQPAVGAAEDGQLVRRRGAGVDESERGGVEVVEDVLLAPAMTRPVPRVALLAAAAQ